MFAKRTDTFCSLGVVCFVFFVLCFVSDKDDAKTRSSNTIAL